MKFKRFLSLFFVVLLAVCIPCAFLAGCNGNSDDDGTDGNTSNNGSNGDKTGSGDEIFTEGMTLAQLRAATENVDNYTVESRWSWDNNNFFGCLKVDGNDSYQLEEHISAKSWEDYMFNQDGYRYEVSTESDINGKETEIRSSKSLLTNVDINKSSLYLRMETDSFSFIDGEAGLEINVEKLDGYGWQVTSSYVRLKGSVLEYGYTAVVKEGTSSNIDTMQGDAKIYGVNATVVDTGKIQSELVNAEWAYQVSYNGYSYRKAVDKDGNEYYYIESSNNSEAEPEKTINTLPVKPRES